MDGRGTESRVRGFSQPGDSGAPRRRRRWLNSREGRIGRKRNRGDIALAERREGRLAEAARQSRSLFSGHGTIALHDRRTNSANWNAQQRLAGRQEGTPVLDK